MEVEVKAVENGVTDVKTHQWRGGSASAESLEAWRSESCENARRAKMAA